MSYHQSRFQANPKRALVWKILVSHLQKKFDLGDRILELGCGYGDFINHVQAKFKIALDASSEMKNYLNPEVQFISAKLPCQFSIDEGSMDTVFASNILEHLSRTDIDVQLKEVHRILKPNGKFLVFGPNYQRAYKNYFDDYTHLTPISHVGMCDWLKASGFQISYCHPGLMPFSIKDSKLPIFGWLIKLWLFLPFKWNGAQMLIVAKKE